MPNMAESTQASAPAGIGVNTLVMGAWLAWLIVVSIGAWLMWVRMPQVETTFQEADLVMPISTEWALSILQWARAHWQVVSMGALVPLVLLIVMRKLMVVLIALGMTFSAGMALGAMAVVLWLPDAMLDRLRLQQQRPQWRPAVDAPTHDTVPVRESVYEPAYVE